MFQHIDIFSSFAAPALIAFCFFSGAFVYLVLHNWRNIAALAQSRSQLLSVGAIMALAVGWPVYHLAARTTLDNDFFSVAKSLPHAQTVTAESLAAAGLPVVATYHNDNSRTGQNPLETSLTPDNVNAARFGKLYSFPVDGYIYAQPLFMPQVAVPGNGIHNVVVVATQHDSVYAFDADSPAPEPLWKVSFINPDAGVTTLSSSDVNASDIMPEIGITSTPVIDIGTNTLYVVAATKENGAFYHRLHALDMTSGAEKFGGPRTIQASYPGAAQDASDGVLTFSSRLQLQRAALLLSKGKIYIAFASNADYGLYHGWVVAYDAATLRQSGAWVSTPNGYQGGIWMSGCGISSDHQGNLYLSTANGPFDSFGDEPGTNFSDSVVKLRPGPHGIALADFFTPSSQARMARDDLDLGSSGVLLLPDQPGPYPHLAITSGKNGHIYVLNRDSLGGYYLSSRSNPQVVQEISGQLKQQMGTPAYWNGKLYFGAGISPQKDGIKAFSLRNGVVSTVAASQSAAIYHLTRSTVSVSANGNANGIVWAVDNDAYYSAHQGSAVLHAYDARNLSRELYNSAQRPRDNPGPASKFTVPTIAAGKVFVGTANSLSVYGLLGTGN